MDPLSVAASVAGLVSLAGQLVPALYNLGSTVKEANKDAQAAATEVANMSVVLQGLQSYIVGRTRANPQRLRLITVEHITASLTTCVITYSELDAVLKALHVDSGLKGWDRAVWFMKRESVQNLVSRLQNHKMSFTCMLNILQCDSAGEAERSMDRLCDQVELLLKENKELSARLSNLELLSGGASSLPSVATIAQTSSGQGKNPTPARTTTSRSSCVQSINSNGSQTVPTPALVALTGTRNAPPIASAFEEQLHQSRVYRHAHANHSESSLVNDSRSTLALSLCSSLTLDEISNISVFALPIFAVELSNASTYDFARPTGLAQTQTPSQSGFERFEDATPMPADKQETLEMESTIILRSDSARSEQNIIPGSVIIDVEPFALNNKTVSSVFDGFLDFCLTCDKECEGAYCSQACRLADLEATTAHSMSPAALGTAHSGNILKPAFGFTERDKCWTPYPTATWTSQPSKTRSPSLLTSSSASHSSIIGAGPGKQARAELLEYFRAFDEARTVKRGSVGSK